MKKEIKIKYDERKAREMVIKGKLHDIITKNEPMVAIAIIVENLPKFYEFLTPLTNKYEKPKDPIKE